MQKVGWLLFLLLLGCTGPANRQPSLTIFAASSLTNVFTEIGSAFESAHPGVDVRFNFAGSQVLQAQVRGGAQVDVVALADTDEMQPLLEQDALVETGTVKYFASNRMILILPGGNPLNIDSPRDLALPGVKLALAAEQVPAGRYARAVLAKLDEIYGLDFSARALANVVSNEENVRQVLSKVQLGEADVGIVYSSDAAAGSGLVAIPFPDEANPIIFYPIAIMKSSPQKPLAAEFVDFILSEQGQALLQKWGFLPASG